MPDSNPEDAERRLQAGDHEAFDELLKLHRQRLKRMVALRLDQRLTGRIDPSDVIQDACLEASSRLPEYLRELPMPFYLWLRWLAGERLLTLHRRHLTTKKRDARREHNLDHMPHSNGDLLAARLVGTLTGPSDAAVRDERLTRVREALDRMDPIDREIIALRSFEQLTRNETAKLLQIEKSAASKRYIRALRKLKAIVLEDSVS